LLIPQHLRTIPPFLTFCYTIIYDLFKDIFALILLVVWLRYIIHANTGQVRQE